MDAATAIGAITELGLPIAGIIVLWFKVQSLENKNSEILDKYIEAWSTNLKLIERNNILNERCNHLLEAVNAKLTK